MQYCNLSAVRKRRFRLPTVRETSGRCPQPILLARDATLA